MVTDVKKLPVHFDRDRVVAFCRDRGIGFRFFGYGDELARGRKGPGIVCRALA